MKVIRAVGAGIYVPTNPENPDKNSMRLVQKGLIAIVPADFPLPKEKYEDMGKLRLDKKKD